jgi:hypothetical protein
MGTFRKNRKNRSRIAPIALALLATVAAMPLLASTAPAQARVPAVANPSLNVPRTAAMEQACGQGTAAGCQLAVVGGIDQARATEGVAPLHLPSNYDALSGAAQLLVLTDLERVDRGLPGFTGLSVTLDGLAKKGAVANTDPTGPAGRTWGSNWAGGEPSALMVDYDFMYNDGPGSPNLDCTIATPNGCWDHRRNILSDYGRHPSMGAAATKVDGVTSFTELLASGSA